VTAERASPGALQLMGDRSSCNLLCDRTGKLSREFGNVRCHRSALRWSAHGSPGREVNVGPVYKVTPSETSVRLVSRQNPQLVPSTSSPYTQPYVYVQLRTESNLSHARPKRIYIPSHHHEALDSQEPSLPSMRTRYRWTGWAQCVIKAVKPSSRQQPRVSGMMLGAQELQARQKYLR
jgi:hypothetical protein